VGAVRFADRDDAGRRLGRHLAVALPPPEPGRPRVVLGLPRGGVVVAHHVARALQAPLDVVVVRKIGAPGRAEYAVGAVSEGGVMVVDRDALELLGIDDDLLAELAAARRADLEDLLSRLRRDRVPLPLDGVEAIIVDDGLATGATALAACRTVRARGAARIVLAVPVGPRRVPPALASAADEVVVLDRPFGFQAVGESYDEFRSVSEATVAELLDRQARAG
jgi:putative phosphoribosyl transferase